MKNTHKTIQQTSCKRLHRQSCFWLLIFGFVLFPNSGKAQDFVLDTSFNSNYMFSNNAREVQEIYIEPDGKVVLAGYIECFPPFPNTCGVFDQRNLLRLLQEGTVDTNFNSNHFSSVYSSTFQRTNFGYFLFNYQNFIKMYYFGTFSDSNYTAHQDEVKQQQHNGFSVALHNVTDYVYNETTGKVIGGSAFKCVYDVSDSAYHNFIFRLTQDGFVDTTFKHTVDDAVYGFLPYNDSLIIVYGVFNWYDSVAVNTGIAMINEDGNYVPGYFQNAPLPCNNGLNSLHPLHVDKQGRILMASNCIPSLGPPFSEGFFMRLLPNGAVDNTFHISKNKDIDSINNSSGAIYTACPTSDSGYLLGGIFTHYEGYKRSCIVKIDSNGYIDTNYFTGTGFEDIRDPSWKKPVVYAIESGNFEDVYYVGGNFTHFNGKPVDPIIRLKKTTIGNPPIPGNVMTFLLYPNPADNYTVIKLPPQIKPNQTTIKIYNILGMLVQEIQLKTTISTINTSALQAGVYFVTVNSPATNFKPQKLIIH